MNYIITYIINNCLFWNLASFSVSLHSCSPPVNIIGSSLQVHSPVSPEKTTSFFSRPAGVLGDKWGKEVGALLFKKQACTYSMGFSKYLSTSAVHSTGEKAGIVAALHRTCMQQSHFQPILSGPLRSCMNGPNSASLPSSTPSGTWLQLLSLKTQIFSRLLNFSLGYGTCYHQ